MKREMLVRPSLNRAWLGRWLGLLLIVVLLASGTPSGAREPEPAEMPIPAVVKVVVEEKVRMPAEFNPKLDSALNQLLEAQRTDGMAGVQAFAETHQMVLEGDRVQVMLVTEPTAIPGLAQAVEAWGGQIQGDYAELLQALVPVDALEPLAARSDVQLIREPRRAIEMELPEAGSVTTEGVVASNAAAWHSAGYDGTGVRVAVIDAGFTGYSTLLGSDLPSSVGTHDWTGYGMGGTEHGTACAEIVHDMAPGATMDLHKISTVVELNQAVSQAIADGVDVISTSVGWTLDGPGDGTGPLANIVNTARSNGILWATAAGNEAEVTWAGTYDDYYLSANDMHLHAWDGVDLWFNFMGPGTGSCYVFPAGTPLRAGLHWDDWSAVDQDYDLYLARWPGSGGLILVASSTEPQNGGVGQTPQEYISYTAAGGNCYAWIVERVNSNRDVCLRLSAPKMVHLDQWTPARSVTFPADSPDALTVGAVDVNSPYPLESYSSQGPTFGPGGACSGGAIKPDIASYANVSTVSYGAGIFNGTSAATPHVAGAAVLVKGRFPGYSVTQLQDYLENEALDLGTAGKDTLYGSGRLYLPGVGNTPPTISGLPDQTLAVNTSRDNAIDLWAYAEDAQDSDPDLLFTISNTPDPNAGVSIDSNRYIDINPALDWTGTTDVEIQVEDTGELTDTDIFQVAVGADPDIEVSPTSFEETLREGGTVTRILTIRNVGQGTLSFSIAEVGTTADMSIPVQPTGNYEQAYRETLSEVTSSQTAGRTEQSIVETKLAEDMLEYHKDLLANKGVSPEAIGDVILSFASPGSSAVGLAWDGESLWDADGFQGTTSIYKLDPADGSLLSTFPPPGGYPEDLAWDGEYLWNVDFIDDLIYKVDPSDGSILTSIPAPTGISSGLTWDGVFLWVSEWYSNQIYKIDPSDGSVVTSFSGPEPGEYPRGLAWDGSSLWCTYSSTIYKLDPSDGSLITSFSAPSVGATGLAWDGQYLWNNNWVTNWVYKIEVGSVSDCPWLSENPTSGTVSAGGSQPVGVTLNATGLAPGDYTCNLVIENNDPDENPVTVPVVMHVTESLHLYLPLTMRNFGSVPIPTAPTLNPIQNNDGDGNYTVSWGAVSGATSYTLEEDDNGIFISPETVYSGPNTSTSITDQEPGTYFYRVKASNAAGDSDWSNTQSVDVLSSPSGPNPGYWQRSGGAIEFYVTSDRAYVDDFAIIVDVPGCGIYKITHTPLEPIVSNHFSFSGSFYGNGTFSSSTVCSGTTGLSSFYIPGCGYVSGGPYSYTATWQGMAQAATHEDSVSVVVEKVDEEAIESFLTAEVDPQ